MTSDATRAPRQQSAEEFTVAQSELIHFTPARHGSLN